MKVFYPVCSPTDPFATFFSCTVCSHTKPKNSSFTLIFGVCLTLFCSVAISWFCLRGSFGKKNLARFYHTHDKYEWAQKCQHCWALPWSHTVFNGSCMSSLHLLGARLGNNCAYSGLVREPAQAPQCRYSQIIIVVLLGWQLQLGKWTFELSGTWNTHKDGRENETLNLLYCPWCPSHLQLAQRVQLTHGQFWPWVHSWG